MDKNVKSITFKDGSEILNDFTGGYPGIRDVLNERIFEQSFSPEIREWLSKNSPRGT
jgi:hypothetical protein